MNVALLCAPQFLDAGCAVGTLEKLVKYYSFELAMTEFVLCNMFDCRLWLFWNGFLQEITVR